MKRRSMTRHARTIGITQAFLAALVFPTFAQNIVPPLPPFLTGGEALQYTVSWPSGLTLGDVMLTALPTGAGFDLDMTLDAGVPGFSITDRFHSLTGSGLCSLEFDRKISHGGKKSGEKTSFDYPNHTAHRTSLDGATSDLPVSGTCAYDALAFLYAVRRDLAVGAPMPSGPIYFGPVYSVKLESLGQQTVRIGSRSIAADRVLIHLKGHSSTRDFEIFFARDPARTPVLARVPTNVGTISLELDLGS
jgi:hypothetical protein